MLKKTLKGTLLAALITGIALVTSVGAADPNDIGGDPIRFFELSGLPGAGDHELVQIDEDGSITPSGIDPGTLTAGVWDRTGSTLFPTTADDKVNVESASTNALIILGNSTATTGSNNAVTGYTASTGSGSKGMLGQSTAATGTVYGVYGDVASSNNAAYGGLFDRGDTGNVGAMLVGFDLQEFGADPNNPPAGFLRIFGRDDHHPYALTSAGVKTALDSTGGGGSMSSFSLAGDVGTPQTIVDGDTLSVIGGTNGIDTSAGSTDTVTVNLDTTEIDGDKTFGAAANAANVWTMDLSANDPTIIWGAHKVSVGASDTIEAPAFSVTNGGTVSTTTGVGDLLHIRGRATTGGTWQNLIDITNGALAALLDFPQGATWNGNYIYHATGTDVPITDGGTGASDAPTAIYNLGQMNFVPKILDETLTNTATLQDDDVLQFPVTAGKYYTFKFVFSFTTTAAADFKYGVAYTQTEQRCCHYADQVIPGTGGSVSPSNSRWTSFGNSTSLTGTGTTGGFVRIEGTMLAHATNAGTVKLQWAQATQTNDSGIILHAGSYCEYRQLN